MTAAATTYRLDRAWVHDAVHDDVEVTVAGGRFTAVRVPGRDDLDPRGAPVAPAAQDTSIAAGASRPAGKPGSAAPASAVPQSAGHRPDPTGHPGDPERTRSVEGTPVVRVPGLTIPGLANCHSHAFHRALRGRTQRGRGSFWTWREQMYAVAGRLDPDTYRALAGATFAEMAAAGITAVGEFHYLHHQPDGTPYTDPNEMGLAVLDGAREAGIRIALLDTCYVASGFGTPVDGVQRRFGDGDAAAWADRATALRRHPAATGDGVVLGAAAHSVRAVPADQLAVVADWTRDAGPGPLPLHVHLSEQDAENDACRAVHGVTPTRLLADHGVLGPATTAVHATRVDADDIGLLGGTGTHACLCPTTERDLGDGIGPSRQLAAAGSPLTLGSDSQAVVDPFEEMRAVELHERLASRRRGHWGAAELLAAATHVGHRSLGFPDAGRIAVGQRADLVTLDLDGARLAGTGRDEHAVVFAAVAEDVVQVMVDGRIVVRPGDRVQVGRDLAAAIGPLWT